MVISGNKSHEATVEETNFINNYYKFAKDNYNFNKFSLKSCSNDLLQKVKDEFEIQQGNPIYKHYNFIKFHLNNELVINTAKLKHDAKLNDNCGNEANSLICNKLYEVVLKFIHNNNIQKNICNMSFEEFLDDFELNGAPTPTKNKFNENWNFNLDDDFIKRTIKELVIHFIKID